MKSVVMWSASAALGLCLLSTVAAKSVGLVGRPPATGLTVRDDAEKIVMHWKGPIAAPMHERLEEVFQRFEGDERRIVISLDSPGGSVDHGRQIMTLIHAQSHHRNIDTLVTKGSICASMCVPIYLTGFERGAHPNAKFMFHEATIRFKPEAQRALQDLQRASPRLDVAGIRKHVATRVTDELFEGDIGHRGVDARWLTTMRDKIRGRDVWLTGRQLMDQGSGVVDKLLM